MRGFAVLALLIVSVFGWFAQRADAGRFTRTMVAVADEVEERDAALGSASDRRSKRLRDALAKVLRELRRSTRSLSADLKSAERAARVLRESVGPDTKVDALLDRAARSYLTTLTAEASSLRRVLRATAASAPGRAADRQLDVADAALAHAAAATDPLRVFHSVRDADAALRAPRKVAARALPSVSSGRVLGAGESFSASVDGAVLRAERIAASVVLGERVTLTFKVARDVDAEFVALTFPYSPTLRVPHVAEPRGTPYAVSHGLVSEANDARRGTGTITFDVGDGDLGNYGGTFDVAFGESRATGSFRVSCVS